MNSGDTPSTIESGRQPPPNREGLLLLIVFGVFVLGIAVLVNFRFLPGSSSGPMPSAPAPLAKSPGSDTNEPGTTKPVEPKSDNPFSPFPSALTKRPDEPVRVVENSSAELRARVKARVLALQQIGREIRESLVAAEKNSVEWAKLSEDILTSEVGRKLATQPDLVERFDALVAEWAKRPTTAATVTSWRERLTELLKPLVLPADDAHEVAMPGSGLETDLQSLQREIAERGKEAHENLAGLNALIAAAREVKPGEQTLQQVMASVEGERQRKLVESKLAGRRKADDAARADLEQAEQRKRAAELAQQVAEKNAETARQKKAADDATEAVARKQRIAKNKNSISQYLEPFISPGYAQPRQMSGTFMDVVQTKEKKPMSLAGLRKIGALNDDEAGMRKLYRAASSFSNDRPKWSEAYDHELTVKAHQLLLDLGEDMVLEGILSP